MPSRFTTALLTLALIACESPAPFGSTRVPEPVLFAPGAISTDAREYGITFSPDATEAYFTRRAPGRRSAARVFVSRFVDGAWTEAVPAPFSSGWEESPYFTMDGERLLYSSRRPVPGWGPVPSGGNLWFVERRADGWSAPAPLPGDVNKPRVDGNRSPARGEAGPVILSDGTLLYWTTEDHEWGSDLYAAEERDGAYVNARPLRLNTGGAESSPAMSPDGRYLLFQGLRDADALGGDDLYVAEGTDYGWGAPRLLPEPINSPFNDGYPSFSPDGRFFFFASDRDSESGYWSIYYVETAALGLEDAH